MGAAFDRRGVGRHGGAARDTQQHQEQEGGNRRGCTDPLSCTVGGGSPLPRVRSVVVLSPGDDERAAMAALPRLAR